MISKYFYVDEWLLGYTKGSGNIFIILLLVVGDSNVAGLATFLNLGAYFMWPCT